MDSQTFLWYLATPRDRDVFNFDWPPFPDNTILIINILTCQHERSHNIWIYVYISNVNLGSSCGWVPEAPWKLAATLVSGRARTSGSQASTSLFLFLTSSLSLFLLLHSFNPSSIFELSPITDHTVSSLFPLFSFEDFALPLHIPRQGTFPLLCTSPSHTPTRISNSLDLIFSPALLKQNLFSFSFFLPL